MKLLDYLFGWLGGASSGSGVDDAVSGIDTSDVTGSTINPATGLPMIGDCGGVDVGGSPFGFDIHHDDWGSSENIGIHEDTWTYGSSNWDEPFPSSPSNWHD